MFPTVQRFLIFLMENIIQPVHCVQVFAVSCRKIPDPSLRHILKKTDDLFPHSNICLGLSAAGILMTKHNEVWRSGEVTE